MVKIILKDGTEREVYLARRSKTGKNYVVTTRICDCYRNTCDCVIEENISTNDILSINGEDVEPYIPKSVKYKQSKYKVTKVWEYGGHKWFKVSGSAAGGRYHYKIIGKDKLEEYHFFRSTKKERAKGAPMVICRQSEELSIPIEILREIYKVYIINQQEAIKEKCYG